MQSNPYAPPRDDTPFAGSGPIPEGGFVEGGRGVGVGRGVAWITEGWELVKGSFWTWLVIGVLYGILAIVLTFIPVVGQLAFATIAPVLSAGVYLGCRDVREGRGVGVGHLFEGFKHAAGLLGVGLVHLAQALVMGGVGLITGAGGAFVTRSPLSPTTANPLDPSRLQALGIFMGVTIVLSIPVGMATYYAPALVAIRRMPVIAALKNSFLGATRNVLPFIVFMLVTGLLSIAAVIPCGLGFLVLGPVLMVSPYISYRDVFFVEPSP